MSKEQKRAVIIVGPGYEDVEAMYPYYRLQEEGIKVDVATSNDLEVYGKYGIPMKPTVKLAQLSPDIYDIAVIPGGNEGPDRVRQAELAVKFVRDMYDQGKLVSSICHGPWVLIEAEIVKAKHMTCYVGMKTDLKNAGALYEASPAIVDGNIITSDHPRNLGSWMKSTIEQLRSRS